MARAIGAQPSVLERILRKHGVYEPGRRFSGRYTADQKREMVVLYEAGQTAAAIAARFGCDRVNVRSILITQGVELRTGPRYPLSPALEGELRRLRAEGLTFAQIGKQMGVPEHRARLWGRMIGLSKFIPKRGADSNLYAGGRYVDTNGYWYVAVDHDDPMASMRHANGYVPEHRLVMARHLGRPLVKGETVHHIDTDKNNNRIENLQLRQGQHGKGGAFVCQDCGSHNVAATELRES